MSVKITDLIEKGVIEHLKELDSELSKVLDTYTKVAKDLAKGLEISVSGIEDIDRLERLLVERGREAAQVQQQLTRVVSEQGQVVANTTNTISRQLMEQERVNKTQREAYTEHDRVKKLLEQYHVGSVLCQASGPNCTAPFSHARKENPHSNYDSRGKGRSDTRGQLRPHVAAVRVTEKGI